MRRKHKNNIIGGIIIAIMLFIVVGVGSWGVSNLSVIGNEKPEIYKPEYASIWCAPSDIGISTIPISIIPNKNWIGIVTPAYLKYECASGKYAPKGCFLDVQPNTGWAFDNVVVYVCNDKITEQRVKTELEKEIKSFKSGADIDGCQKYSKDMFSTNQIKTIVSPMNHNIYIMTERQVSGKIQFEQFGLRTLESGKLLNFPTCYARELYNSKSIISTQGATFNGKPLDINQEISYGAENSIRHVIVGYTAQYNSVNLVKRNNVWVFLKREQDKILYCPLITNTKDGKIYVDDNNCKEDSKYVCLPSNPIEGYSCKDGIELVKSGKKGEPCSATTTSKIDGKMCTVVCKDGFISDIRNCVEITDENSGKVPPITGGQNEKNNSINTTILIILGIVILLIILMLVVKKQMGGSSSNKLQL
jgi:NADH:ubiquinone oxidoreductase subunit 3 (subunit A)